MLIIYRHFQSSASESEGDAPELEESKKKGVYKPPKLASVPYGKFAIDNLRVAFHILR